MSNSSELLLNQMIAEIQDLKRRMSAVETDEYVARAGTARSLDTQFPDALLHLPFDGGVPYEQDFSVNLFGHKLQRPTVASGSIIGRPGKFGKAVQLAEATTNLIGNPTMREPGWWAYGIGAGSITQEYRNDATALGGKVLRATLSGCTSWTHFFRANGETLAPNTTYTVRFRLRASQARSIIFWVGRPDYPYSQYLIHGFSATTEWQEFSFTQTTPADTTNGYVYAIEAGTNPPDMWFELDYCQVEAKAYPTPIAEGSMGPGHAWTGTPYASTSTRTATDLYYEQSLPAADGTISAWVKEESAIGIRCVVRQDRSGSTYVILRYTTTGVEVYWGQIAEAIIGLCARDKDWHHLVVTRSGTLVSVYRDGVLLTSATMSAIGSPTTATTVGQAPGPAEWVNGYIDDLLILDRALTAPEVRALYAAGQAGLGVLCPPQWKVDDSGAADAHVVATDASGDLTIANTEMKAGDWALNPSDSTTIDIDIPLAPFSLLVTVGGYGNASSGNVNGMWLVAGYGNASVNVTINQLVNVIGNGSMTCAWQASGVLRVTITNSHPDRTKYGFWRTVLLRR